ncbi:VOC family protein [Tsukamurella soli]|uniref:Glyoxalase n=1 Tax=Tsukamurella soli TaxID=644556 RepID=A0ABP8J0I2_9ACTN
MTDHLLLDVPAASRGAHARLLGWPGAGNEYTVGDTRVHVGLPAWAGAPGLLLGVRGPDDGEASAAGTVGEAARLLGRRGLTLQPVPSGDGDAQLWSAEVNGLTVGFAPGCTSAESGATGAAAGTGAKGAATENSAGQADREIVGVDHVVLTSPNRDRTLATLCARLGFDLRLDRVQSWGVHQLFLRRGPLLVEVVLQDDADPAGPDLMWGIAWRTADIDVTCARLVAVGVTVGDIRRGHKPGTRVATVKDRDLGLPTLLIEQG